MKNEYDIIYADPPWSYQDKSMNRGGAERHYSTMNLKDICQLNIPANEIGSNQSNEILR